MIDKSTYLINLLGNLVVTHVLISIDKRDHVYRLVEHSNQTDFYLMSMKHGTK